MHLFWTFSSCYDWICLVSISAFTAYVISHKTMHDIHIYIYIYICVCIYTWMSITTSIFTATERGWSNAKTLSFLRSMVTLSFLRSIEQQWAVSHMWNGLSKKSRNSVKNEITIHIQLMILGFCLSKDDSTKNVFASENSSQLGKVLEIPRILHPSTLSVGLKTCLFQPSSGNGHA